MTFSQKLKSIFDTDDKKTDLWDGQYKIPWNEPDFSQRMLKEHLSQDHDLASRRNKVIAEQVSWVHENICENQPKHLLDIGCGPGLYMEKFSDLGYLCHGVDFSPASINHARSILKKSCTVSEGDLRHCFLGNNFDIAIMIFGEFNVFSFKEEKAILKKVYNALNPGATFLIEIQEFNAVKQSGLSENTWTKAESGLFSDRPHLCLIESRWYEVEETAVQKFYIIDIETAKMQTLKSTTRAVSHNEMVVMLEEAGFTDINRQETWPSGNNGLVLYSAVRK